MTRVYFVRHAQPEHDWEEGKIDSVVPYIIDLDFESCCNVLESECPIYSFKLIAKQEHCYIEKEFKGKQRADKN